MLRFPRILGLLVLLPLLWCLSGCGWVVDRLLRDNPVASMAVGSAQAAAAKAPMGIEEEKMYGDSIAVKIVRRYGGLVEDEALQRYVALVGNTIVGFSDRPGRRFYFGILKHEGVNAVSAPGGWIFVTMGALRTMKTEAELAGVLAHEIAHVTQGHAVNIIQNLKASEAMTTAATRGGTESAAMVRRRRRTRRFTTPTPTRTTASPG